MSDPVNNRKKMETARRFLWDEDEEKPESQQQHPYPSTQIRPKFASNSNTAGVDQSINLMATDSHSSRNIGNVHEPHSQKNQRVNPIIVCLRERCGGQVLCFAICMVLVMALAITLIMQSSDSDDGIAGGSPIFTPSKSVQWTNQQKPYANLFVKEGISSESNLKNADSPQYKALKWLVDDSAKVGVDDSAVVDRYALAVLYHAMDGSNWEYDGLSGADWLSDKGLCMWRGIRCMPRDYKGKDGETSSQPAGEEGAPGDVTFTYDDNKQVFAIHLSDVGLEGASLPREIFFLPILSELDLSENKIEGLPDLSLTRTALRSINLRQNRLSGSVVIDGENANFGSTLGSTLRSLDMGENQMTGPLPVGLFERCQEMRELALDQNKFTGTLPTAEIAAMNKLTKLFLDNNEISGTINKDSIGSWSPAMLQLRLHKNKLTGKVPDEIKALKRLELLHLDNNGFTGSIPNVFASLSRLDQLQLQHNEFRYHIPESMHQLSGLKKLFLDHNKLTGSIPEHFSSMNDLKVLYLDNNRLSYEIPSTLGLMEDLVDLRLNSNRIHGSIPTQLGKCYRLKNLYLDGNELTGTVPDEFKGLDELVTLHLHHNKMTGSVSDEICELKESFELSVITADCKNDVVDCKCCSACY